jgi:hypothetical protein
MVVSPNFLPKRKPHQFFRNGLVYRTRETGNIHGIP